MLRLFPLPRGVFRFADKFRYFGSDGQGKYTEETDRFNGSGKKEIPTIDRGYFTGR